MDCVAEGVAFNIPDEDIENVGKKLDEIMDDASENAPFVDEDGDPSWGPVVLCENVKLDDFERWLAETGKRVGRWIYEPLSDDDDGESGRVVLHSLSTRIHGRIVGNILQSVTSEIQLAGNNIPLINTIEILGSPTCKTGRNYGQEPDMSMSPAGLTIGGSVRDSGYGYPFPNLVIEVAYKNESLSLLQSKLYNWMLPSTSVQVAIGIKIFVNTPERHRAILYLRNIPTQEVEFGMDAGEGPITLDFPLELFYQGVPMPPALADLVNPIISIDLIELRNCVHNCC